MSVRTKRTLVLASATVALLGLTACGSSGNTKSDNGKKTGVTLKVLIGSSGDAETNALNAAAKAWSAKSGNTVVVTPAKDLT